MLSRYRITVTSFAERGADTHDQVSRYEQRFYANTETGINRHMSRVYREAMSGAVHKYSTLDRLDRHNNPVESLFAPGYIAKLADTPHRELIRIRIRAYFGSAALFPWEITWISVEQYAGQGWQH